MKMSQSYFPGLNALRFFAAFLVIFHHIEQYKYWSGHESLWGNHGIDEMGHLPVAFFFVLSGFLITYLLMKEVKKQGSINLRFFYWKRMIRIWPLYFIIVFLALVVMPLLQGSAFENLPKPGWTLVVPLIFFMPNLLRVMFPTLIGGNQLWSVGIEEQFYLIWPVLIQLFRKRLLVFLIGFVVLKTSLGVTMGSLFEGSETVRLSQLWTLYKLFPIEQMAVGGIGAWLWMNDVTFLLKRLSNKWLVMLNILLMFTLDNFLSTIYLDTLVQAIVFMQVIFFVVRTPSLHVYLENRVLKHLGDISYGIYMWHTAVIAVIISIPGLSGLWPYVLAPTFTLVVAHFSYLMIEKKFLRLRNLKLADLLSKFTRYA